MVIYVLMMTQIEDGLVVCSRIKNSGKIYYGYVCST